MACPICGANCKCKNRGPSGLCCSCHRHKPSAATVEAYLARNPEISGELVAAVEKHKQDILAAANEKSWGDVMAKRKDLRNGHESGAWKPSKWRPERVRRYRRHVAEYIGFALSFYFPPHEVRIVCAEIAARIAEADSADGLHADGIKTLGDIAAERED